MSNLTGSVATEREDKIRRLRRSALGSMFLGMGAGTFSCVFAKESIADLSVLPLAVASGLICIGFFVGTVGFLVSSDVYEAALTK